MAARGMAIHLRLSLMPIDVASPHDLQGLLHAAHGSLGNFAEEHASSFIAQRWNRRRRRPGCAGPGRGGREEVHDVLLVDFQVGRAQLHTALRRGCKVQQLLQRPGNEANLTIFHGVVTRKRAHAGGAEHRVGLAGARLPVRQDGSVEPIDDALHDRLGDDVVHILLHRAGLEDVVEEKGRVGLVRAIDTDLARLAVGPEAHALPLRTGDGLIDAQGPKPDGDLNAVVSLAEAPGAVGGAKLRLVFLPLQRLPHGPGHFRRRQHPCGAHAHQGLGIQQLGT
mmetsp:Transcript_26917/g.78048  ORF Transcript_26917/g.78048 Transcript_26917/m.78048 type:complete len:281 (+) Transcript_26917:1361-2203(+)